MLVIDLGVPRNVDPGGRHAGRAVTLLDMDTLSASVAAGARRPRRRSQWRRSSIVAEEVERFRTASRQRGAAPVIAALRARLESLREAELERHRAQLADLTEAEWEQVDAATRAALAKLLHEPTMLLKETAGTPRGERLVEALRILFDLWARDEHAPPGHPRVAAGAAPDRLGGRRPAGARIADSRSRWWWSAPGATSSPPRSTRSGGRASS